MSMKNNKHLISEREKIKGLNGKKRLQYIWDYYKLPITIFLIVLYIIIYSFYGYFTRNNYILYTAFVNVSTSDALTQELTDGFLKGQNLDTSKNHLYLYENLYLADDVTNENHEYTYASQMEILGAIESEKLDLVLMNKEAFDAFSQNGYLCNLTDLLNSDNTKLLEKITPYLETNTVILQDNATDLYFDKSIPYEATTDSYPMGINLSHSPIFLPSGISGTIYLGVIDNSPRQDTAVEYIRYLFH